MKRILVLVALGALAAAALNLTAPDTRAPAGCPDTAPGSLSGVVSSKQADGEGPELIASNGDECWHLMISNRTLSGNLISVYVSRNAYDDLSVGDPFKREQDK